MQLRKQKSHWNVDVSFNKQGALLATATGVLLLPPEEAVELVTNEAGDKLFRVVERTALPNSPSGGRRVEVVNQAAIRVLAWKLWSKSNVIYEITHALTHAVTHPSGVLKLEGAKHQQQQAQVPSKQHREERVQFELVSSSMLKSLSGTWRLQPLCIHTSALQQHTGGVASLSTSELTLAAAAAAAGAAQASGAAAATAAAAAPVQLLSGCGKQQRPVVQVTARTSSGSYTAADETFNGNTAMNMNMDKDLDMAMGMNMNGSRSSISNIPMLPGLRVDAGGYVMATLVHYEQLAQPKGLPPGIRFVPGLSDAVAASVGREVRQMLDKVACVADVAITKGCSPQEALSTVVQQLEAAGGSFKSLQKHMHKQQQQQQQQQMLLRKQPSSGFGTTAAAGAAAAGATAGAAGFGGQKTVSSSKGGKSNLKGGVLPPVGSCCSALELQVEPLEECTGVLWGGEGPKTLEPMSHPVLFD